MADRVLTTISLLCSDMAGRWHSWTNMMTAVVQGQGSTIGGTRGSGHADPTATTAAAIVDVLARAEDLRALMLYAARELDGELARIPADLQDPKAESRLRCTGEYDPTCTAYAVAKGLCYRCYRRKERGQQPTHMLVDPAVPSTRYKPLTAEEAARRINQGEAIANLEGLQLGDILREQEAS